MFGGGGAISSEGDPPLMTGAGGGDNAVLRLSDQGVFLMFVDSPAFPQFRCPSFLYPFPQLKNHLFCLSPVEIIITTNKSFYDG